MPDALALLTSRAYAYGKAKSQKGRTELHPLSVLPRLREPPPTDAQIERQIRWEGSAVEAGIRRYREALNDPAQVLADTSAGQRIIREIMAEFVPWLEDAQGLLREGLFKRGPKEDWTFLMLLLPPDVLALLALRAVMSERPTEKAHLRLLPGCTRSLANSIEQEVAFRSWVAEERANKRLARELGKPYRDLYDALRQKAKKINSRAFRSWMNRLGRLWRQGWDPAEKTKLGNNLIKYLVEHSGGRFELALARYSGKTPRCQPRPKR
jgi:hypothetical protein